MAIEKRKFFFGIPGKKLPVRENDVQLRSPKLSLEDKIICVTVDSDNKLTYFKDGFSESVTKEKINKRKPSIRTTLFTSYKYTWKE